MTLLSPVAVAEQLGVTPRVVLRLIAAGRLEAIRVQRYWRVLGQAAVDKYVHEQRRQHRPVTVAPESTRARLLPSSRPVLPLPGVDRFQ